MADLDLNTVILAVVAPIVSGFIGAWAGQQVAMRREDRRELAAEIRAVNACNSLAVVTTNKYLAMKAQHVRALGIHYEAEQQAYVAFRRPNPEVAHVPRAFQLNMDLKTLEPPVVAIDHLADLCFREMRLPSRAIAAVSDLQTAASSLADALEERAKLIDEHRNLQGDRTPRQATEWYLGLANADGQVDERFKNTTGAIVAYCDDCIFFARTLADDLAKYGKRLGSDHWWRFQRKAVVRSAADWSTVRDQTLLPTSQQYAAWLAGFPVKSRWWRRLWRRS